MGSLLKIKDIVILIGYDKKGNCIYSESLDWSDYYDGEHIWDSSQKNKKLGLVKVNGYLFDEKGKLSQEFESNFNPKTGLIESGYARHEDGTLNVFPPVGKKTKTKKVRRKAIVLG